MKKSVSRFVPLLILCSFLVTLPKINLVKASETIYIRSDGSVDPPTAPISSVDNVTYTFNDNIGEPIVVERSNIIIDGAGYTVEGAGSGNGFRLYNVSNVTIKKANIKNFFHGIFLNSTFGSSISENYLTNNYAGIEVWGPKNNIIYRNTITDNTFGIVIYTKFTNIIFGNNITNNKCGIYFEAWTGNQIIYNNNLINNTAQVAEYTWVPPIPPVIPPSVNVWDNGEEGNYWSDYTGVDADGDGIGDTPYVVNAESQDSYPLMKTVNISAVKFPPETTPPTISIVSPENKTYVSIDVPLIFTLSEPTIWMGYSLDGQANVTITGNTTLPRLSDGAHTLTVYAMDIFGNVGSSDTVYLTVEAIAPSISILSPENKTYAYPEIPLTFIVTETVSWMGYSLDGQANVTITGNITLPTLSDGTHILIAYASDTFRNISSQDLVYFTVDTVSPRVSILSPENKTYDTADIPLTFAVDEPLSWIAYMLNDQANVTITGNTTLTRLPDGSYNIIILVLDVAGNAGVSDIIYFTVHDTVSPNIEILSPENKTYNETDIPLSFAVSESASWMGYSLDGKANITLAGNTTLTGLSDGSHSLKVYAKDTAGNTGTSETIHFSIAQQSESFPTTWIVAAIVIIAVVGAALLVYFRKIRKTTEVEKIPEGVM